MGEPQPEYKPKRTLQGLLRRFYRQTRYFLNEILIPRIKEVPSVLFMGLVLLLCLPIFLLVEAITLVTETIEKCRRYCPVHKERFQYEIFEVPAEEVQENRERIHRRRGMKEIPDERYRDLAQKQFPYANTIRPEYIKTGSHYHRYCQSCRKAEQDYEENDPIIAHRRAMTESMEAEWEAVARCELEALERELGIVQKEKE